MPTNNLNEKAEIEVYSSVLLEAAANPERAFALSDTLTSMVRTVRSNFELKEALFEEGLPADSRAALVRDIFSEYQPEAVEAFAVMAERGEARLASRVAQALQDAAEEKFTCVFARVTTAVPLDDALREQIKRNWSMNLADQRISKKKLIPLSSEALLSTRVGGDLMQVSRPSSFALVQYYLTYPTEVRSNGGNNRSND